MAILGSVAWHNKQVYEAYRSGLSDGTRETAAQYEKSIAEDKAIADKSNQELFSKQMEEYGLLQAKKDVVDSKLADANYQLRTRPTREDLAKLKRSCTQDNEAQTPIGGEGLPREDAEFLAGEAAYATMIQNERDYYYGELQRIFETTTGKTGGLDGTPSNTEPFSGTGLSP